MTINPGNLQDHIEKLRVLNFVGRLGSITKAAALLHITQAAASHSIRVLETVLGVKLLHREARGIRLTDSGKILFDFSQRLLVDIQAAEMMAQNPYLPDAGVLRVGTHETLAIHIWPSFLQEFSKRHKKICVSLISGRVDGLVQGLLNREYQILLTVEPLIHRDLQIEDVYQGVMGLFVGTKATAKSVMTLAEANEISILTDTSAHIRQNLPIPAFLLEHGFKLDRFFELNSFEAAMRLAMKGQGIAVVPERNASSYVKDGLLRPLKIAEINAKKFGNHRICASMLKENSKQPIIRLMYNELLEYCRSNKQFPR